MGREQTQFKPGNQGRKKGAKNNRLTREKIQGLIDSNWSKFEKELSGLKDRAFVENFLKLLEFTTPKYSSINFNLSNMSEQDLQFLIDKLKEQMTHEQ